MVTSRTTSPAFYEERIRLIRDALEERVRDLRLIRDALEESVRAFDDLLADNQRTPSAEEDTK